MIRRVNRPLAGVGAALPADFDFQNFPPPLNDKEAWGKLFAAMREVERLKHLKDVLVRVIPSAEEEEGWTYVDLDTCDWVAVHFSTVSEVEIEPLSGSVEIEINGTVYTGIVGSVRASGIVRVHGLANGTRIRYRVPG